jgi:hypothetical protein
MDDSERSLAKDALSLMESANGLLTKSLALVSAGFSGLARARTTQSQNEPRSNLAMMGHPHVPDSCFRGSGLLAKLADHPVRPSQQPQGDQIRQKEVFHWNYL